MVRLQLSKEMLLSKYSFVNAGYFVGFGGFAAFFPPVEAAVVWLRLFHSLGH